MPDKNIIEPIHASLDQVVDSIFQPAPLNANKNKPLRSKMTSQPAPPQQFVLDIGIERQRNVNGIEMGVLENGIAYLTQTGLAEMAGIARSVVFDISKDWEDHYKDTVLTKDRLSYIKQYLFAKGYNEPKLYIETIKDGSVHNAYPDIVCMAILEYYAFEAKSPTDKARSSYRSLAAYGLQKFIYDALDYAPADPWKLYHARVSLLQDSAPAGYFIVFHEIAPMIVDLINGGLTVNDHTVPDVSVGVCWAKHWKDGGFDLKMGFRQEYAHYYPPQFPQSASNPQMAWAYPDAALPEFRRWFRQEYLTTKFPKYILTKAHALGGQVKAAEIGNMYQPQQIEKK